jgi:hypothetical protein
MTAPSSLVQPEKDLAARAVPHMSQSHYCKRIYTYHEQPQCPRDKSSRQLQLDQLVWRATGEPSAMLPKLQDIR